MKNKLKKDDIISPLCKVEKKGTVSYRIHTFLTKNWDFDIILSNGNPLQRGYYWTLFQKQQLIISIIKEIYIPPVTIIIGGEDDNVWRVVDGKQRVNAIISFLNGDFPLEVNNQEYYFDDLDKELKDRFELSYILFNTIYEPLEKINGKYKIISYSDEVLVALFENINFSGTNADLEHINNLKKSIKNDKR